MSDGFKVGETVAYDTSYTSMPNFVVSKVAKITPTGRINLENGMKFDRHGLHELSSYRYYALRKYDDHVREIVEKREMLEKIKKINWDDLSNETLKKVIEVIEMIG